MTVGECVGKAASPTGRGLAFVFAAPEPDYFILQDCKTGARYRRRRDQIKWRTAAKEPA